jgi:hypothetical protein
VPKAMSGEQMPDAKNPPFSGFLAFLNLPLLL